MTPEPENSRPATAGLCRRCGKPAARGCRECLPCLEHFVRQFGAYESVDVPALGRRPVTIGKN
jgi:predicted amidophosphoribosyltransferase